MVLTAYLAIAASLSLVSSLAIDSMETYDMGSDSTMADDKGSYDTEIKFRSETVDMMKIVEEFSRQDKTGCVDVTYLPDEFGLEVVITLNGEVIIDEKVSAKNPPPICAGIPYFSKIASLCLRFYNLYITDKKLYACADMEAKFAGIVIEQFNLGCFHIPPKSEKI